MLTDRGYNTRDYQNIDYNDFLSFKNRTNLSGIYSTDRNPIMYDDIKKRYNDKKLKKITTKNDSNTNVYVGYIYGKGKTGKSCKEDIIKIIELILFLNVNRLIIISEIGITALVKNQCDSFKHKIRIEFFNDNELVENITKKTLMPTFERTSNTMTISGYLYANDPIVKYFGFQYQDVIKICKNEETIYKKVVNQDK